MTYPPHFDELLAETAAINFSMASDTDAGHLLMTLAGAKPGGSFLELGTGTGLSTAWLLAGMDESSTLVSIDNDSSLLAVAQRALGSDSRLSLVCSDGTAWLQGSSERSYDFIFADTWAGKYENLEAALGMLKAGGLYVIDDMLPQPNWPDGHAAKASALLSQLESRSDLTMTFLAWSTGIVIATKK
jgi:predicted O-methyltransferase YrrM